MQQFDYSAAALGVTGNYWENYISFHQLIKDVQNNSATHKHCRWHIENSDVKESWW